MFAMKQNRDYLRRLKMALLTSTLLLSGTAGAALAQSQADQGIETTQSEVDGVQYIVVTAKNYVPNGSLTANKAAIPLIQTPQSVSVITRDQIDLLNFTDAQQAVRYTSGVAGENYGPDLRFDFFTVRGFTPKQYIDGLPTPITTTIYSIGADLYAFDTVDVLKGPASTLYGNAPPGGLYNETSRRASDSFSGELRGKYGTDNFAEIAGTVTGPIVADRLNARLTALYRDQDSFSNLTHAERAMVAPTATAMIGDNTTITGLFFYQHDKVKGGNGGFLPVQGTLLPNPNGQISPSTNLGDPRNLYVRNQYSAGYELTHKFTDSISFVSNTKYSHYKEDTPTGVYGGGGFTNTTDPTLPTYFRTIQQYNFPYIETVKSFATDNRGTAKFETGSLNHDVIAGVDYRNVKNVAAFGFTFGNLIDAYNPVYTPLASYAPSYPSAYNNAKLQQTGVYLQDHIAFDRLYLTVSGRQDWVTINNYIAANTTKQDKFTYRVGANYVFDSGIAPYISYATSFEPVLGTDSVTSQPFKPSKGEQIEGGVKFDARSLPEDVKLFTTASIFKINQTNVVSTEASVTPVFGQQTGEVEVYGAELEFVGRIRDQWSINGSYTYTHSEVLKNSFAAQVGAPLAVTPKHKISLLVDYTIQRGTFAGLGAGFGGRYTSSSAGALPGLFNPTIYTAPHATLFDTIIHYDTPRYRLAVNGSNIFDKTYVARCAGPFSCAYGAGRQFIGTITAKF